MQGTQVVTHYFNDQLKEDLRRDEMVEKGKLTNYEAEKQADAWAEVSLFKLQLHANRIAQ